MAKKANGASPSVRELLEMRLEEIRGEYDRIMKELVPLQDKLSEGYMTMSRQEEEELRAQIVAVQRDNNLNDVVRDMNELARAVSVRNINMGVNQ